MWEPGSLLRVPEAAVAALSCGSGQVKAVVIDADIDTKTEGGCGARVKNKHANNSFFHPNLCQDAVGKHRHTRCQPQRHNHRGQSLSARQDGLPNSDSPPHLWWQAAARLLHIATAWHRLVQHAATFWLSVWGHSTLPLHIRIQRRFNQAQRISLWIKWNSRRWNLLRNVSSRRDSKSACQWCRAYVRRGLGQSSRRWI